MASKAIQLSVKARSGLGSRANKRLRDEGQVPGVVYGHKEAVVPISFSKKEIESHLNHGAHVFDLAIEGKSEKVLVKEVQYNHLGIDVLHVDFARVSLDEKVTVTVPLELKGTPKGEADGGVLQQFLSDLEIECLVTDIPDAIRFNVSDMGVDSVIHVKEIPLPAGVKALADEDQVVAAVRVIVEEVVETPEGETAQPDVIGRKPEDEAAAAAAK